MLKRPLHLQSEQFPPTGSITADGARKPLGRPTMDPLVLLVRETAQNSWDARIGKKPVQFSIDTWHASTAQRKILSDICFHEMAQRLALKDILESSDTLTLLSISDRNTAGLGGPTRADQADSDGERRNFIEFFRNVGRSDRREVGGGTYGYGKASLYMVSEAQTICAYTRYRDGKRFESRFMAAALGNEFVGHGDSGRKRFTGRHWWGVRKNDGVVDPILNADADALAKAIGLPVLSGSETGSSILIIQPAFGAHRTLLQATTLMMWAFVWYCWPRMCAVDAVAPSLQLSVTCEGKPIAVPDPAKHPILREYTTSLSVLSNTDRQPVSSSRGPEAIHRIEILRPRRMLGMLSLRHVYSTKPDNQLDGLLPEDAVYFPGTPIAHIALLRSPRLVVKYLQGPALPTEQIGYAGVFLADDDMNKQFAEAEPATHDEWNYATLSGESKSFVKMALQRINERVREFVSPPDVETNGSGDIPLGALARRLGGLVADALGPGSEVPPDNDSGGPGGGGKKGTSSPRASVTITSQPELHHSERGAIARVSFIVRHRKGSDSTIVEANPKVLILDGSAEAEPPVGATSPRVVCWIDPQGHRVGTGQSQMTIPAEATEGWAVEVLVPRDTMVAADLRVVQET